MGEKPSRPLFALLFATLAIAARLPFLITGKIPFDSDEAVEGLMARHVLNGELPAFFWGQAFKGVPEVYASAGAFALFGSSVTLLKGVTLAFFAMYVGLNFVLLDKTASRWMAVSASLLLIAAPPALVFWSLDASAEYILTMLLGTALLSISCRAEGREQKAERDKGSTSRRLFAAGLAVGIGLWVHQLFVVYLVPLAIVLRENRVRGGSGAGVASSTTSPSRSAPLRAFTSFLESSRSCREDSRCRSDLSQSAQLHHRKWRVSP